MKNRKELLYDLVLLQGNIDELLNELSKYPWDSEQSILKINVSMFVTTLQKCINNKIDFSTLTLWANAIECRDDLEFENLKMQEAIFELSAPEINGEITKDRLQEIINELNDDGSISRN